MRAPHPPTASSGKRSLPPNVERDTRNYAALKALGWHVVIIWECEVKEILHSRVIPGIPAASSQAYPSGKDTDLEAAEVVD